VTQEQKIKLFSNQFKMKIGTKIIAHQYEVSTTPDIKESFLFNKVVNAAGDKLRTHVGFYVIAGRTIFTPQALSGDLVLETTYNNIPFQVKVSGSARQIFKVIDFESENYDRHLVAANLVNNIIKHAFEDTAYTQIGRAPRFFNLKNGFFLPDAPDDLIAIPGFKASAFRSSDCSTMLIDSLFKFMGQKNCYATM